MSACDFDRPPGLHFGDDLSVTCHCAEVVHAAAVGVEEGEGMLSGYAVAISIRKAEVPDREGLPVVVRVLGIVDFVRQGEQLIKRTHSQKARLFCFDY